MGLDFVLLAEAATGGSLLYQHEAVSLRVADGGECRAAGNVEGLRYEDGAEILAQSSPTANHLLPRSGGSGDRTLLTPGCGSLCRAGRGQGPVDQARQACQWRSGGRIALAACNPTQPGGART